VQLVDVATGASTPLGQNGFPGAFSADGRLATFAVDFREKAYCEASVDWWMVELATGRLTPLATGGAWGQPFRGSSADAIVSPDGTRVLALADVEGYPCGGVYTTYEGTLRAFDATGAELAVIASSAGATFPLPDQPGVAIARSPADELLVLEEDGTFTPTGILVASYPDVSQPIALPTGDGFAFVAREGQVELRHRDGRVEGTGVHGTPSELGPDGAWMLVRLLPPSHMGPAPSGVTLVELHGPRRCQLAPVDPRGNGGRFLSSRFVEVTGNAGTRLWDLQGWRDLLAGQVLTGAFVRGGTLVYGTPGRVQVLRTP
jgi:hypothetical protein